MQYNLRLTPKRKPRLQKREQLIAGVAARGDMYTTTDRAISAQATRGAVRIRHTESTSGR